MRHPLWILNSVLFCLVMAALIFAFFSQQEVPERESIEPSPSAGVKKEVTKITIERIYEHDLFDTYQKEILKPGEPITMPLPEPPKSVPVEIPPIPKPAFIEPLKITLKGIMATSDDSDNVAIIQDNNTKREATYKVGDKVEDAQLIRIFKNKIIFLRSNGQQEVLYLRQQDAQLDPTFAKTSDWKDIIKKVAPNNYQVNPTLFVDKIPNLGDLIDMLDLTTVYQQGNSVGLHVGNTENNALAKALGVEKGDTILRVNDIDATDTKNRVAIYKNVISLHEGDSVKVTLQRDHQIFILTYTLEEFGESKKAEEPLAAGTVSDEVLREEQRKILEKKHTFAPTLQEIRQQERRNMLQKGGAPAPDITTNDAE